MHAPQYWRWPRKCYVSVRIIPRFPTGFFVHFPLLGRADLIRIRDAGRPLRFYSSRNRNGIFCPICPDWYTNCWAWDCACLVHQFLCFDAVWPRTYDKNQFWIDTVFWSFRKAGIFYFLFHSDLFTILPDLPQNQPLKNQRKFRRQDKNNGKTSLPRATNSHQILWCTSVSYSLTWIPEHDRIDDNKNHVSD